jgi:hypothetical protein
VMLVTDRSGTEFCLCPQAPSCATAPEWICMIIVTYLIHDICLRKNIMFGKHDGNTKLNSLWDERVCCTQQAFPTIVLNKCPERVSILAFSPLNVNQSLVQTNPSTWEKSFPLTKLFECFLHNLFNIEIQKITQSLQHLLPFQTASPAQL